MASMKLKRKKSIQNIRTNINSPQIRGPEGPRLKKKKKCDESVITLRQNDNKLALGLTTVLSCFHNL